MEDALTYNVVSSGKLITEFDVSDVERAVADLFNISSEKAASIITKKTVLKKELDHKKAIIYKQKLESIGLEIVLKPNELKVAEPLSLASLSLEPMEGVAPAVEEPIKPTANTGLVTCEKCQLEQPKSVQCAGCGVYFHKISSAVESPAPHKGRAKTDTRSDDHVVEVGDGIKLNGIIAGVVAAVLGALLWKGITLAFEYELGLIAWAIGGVIGFAVAVTGTKGEASGVMCGVLALMAILGGKYLVVENFRSELNDLTSSSSAEMKTFYDAQVEVAKAFSTDVTDEQSLRQFMVDYDYSEFYDARKVTEAEIAEFKASYEHGLYALSNESVGYEQWYQETVQSELANYSTIDIIKEDFGFMDVLFLFLGVGTAFRLGRGEGRMA